MTEEYAEYVQRMRKVRPFQYYGIQPQWHPGEKDVEGFCHDEVVRQFHDTRDWHDGGKRVTYMVDAWHYAQGFAFHTPTVQDIKTLGARVEPDYNLDGFRHGNVRIGNRWGVFPPYLAQTVELLVARAGDVVAGKSRGYAKGTIVDVLQVETFKDQVVELVETIDDWYLAYEWIHPFRDGNGRTGKILHNWLNGTLDDPVLVSDYFKGGNP
jgi:Fic/DOC family